jgi:hypothetical protein
MITTIKVAVVSLVLAVAGFFGYEAQYGADLRVLEVRQGGTGTSTVPTGDQILIGGNNSRYDVKRLRAGSNISISTSSGSVTISSTGGGGGGGDSVWGREVTNGLIYAPTTTDDVLIGATATTTTAKLEVIGSGYFSNGLIVDGNATTSGISRVGNGALSAPSYGFINDVDSGFFLVSAGTLGFGINGAGKLAINSSGIYPYTDGGGSMGVSGNAFANGYYTSGSFIDFGTNNVRLTHSTGNLTLSSGDVFNASDAIVTNSTTTNATTTSFAISSLSSELLKVNGNGSILEALAGTDYEVPITAGDGLTRTANDIDFDGGASPAGDLGGTWASPSVTDDSHAHTGATLSGIDISSDTNLAADSPLVLTGDTLSCPTCGSGGGASIGEAWQFFSSKAWLAPTTTVGIIVNASSTIGSGTQGGGLTVYGGATTTGNMTVVGDANVNNILTVGNSLVAQQSLSVGSGLFVTTTSFLSGLTSMPSGFLAMASSTVGSGVQAGGLTINGGATTTGNLLVGSSVGTSQAAQLAVKNTGSNTNIAQLYNSAGTARLTLTDGGVLTLASISINSGTIQGNSISSVSLLNGGTGTGLSTIVTGAAGVDSFLHLRSTTNAAATSDSIRFSVGPSAATEAMRIITSGHIGIGTTTPTIAPLTISTSTAPQIHVNAGAGVSGWAIRSDNAGTLSFSTTTVAGTATSAPPAVEFLSTGTGVLIGTSTNANASGLAVEGTVFFGSITQATAGTNNDVCISAGNELVEETTGTCVVSSRRFKHDISKLSIDSESVIRALSPSSFIVNGREDEGIQYGFIAEEAYEALPQLSNLKDDRPYNLDDHSFLAVLWDAVKKILARNETQDARLEALEKENAQLKARLDNLEKR